MSRGFRAAQRGADQPRERTETARGNTRERFLARRGHIILCWTLLVLRARVLCCLLVIGCAGGGVAGLTLAGVAPLGGDPELMYLPIKSELSKALEAGELPFWSDRFGLGTPLVAESHVAALYPPNWVLYRLCPFRTAYRLSMWLHLLALAATTFAYARTLKITRGGSALAAVSFTFCGFEALHVVHEPFVHAMPYLPLCLLMANRYGETGQAAWLAGLALAWGFQITVGHFQIQMWTALLVLLLGLWRVYVDLRGAVFSLPRDGQLGRRRWVLVLRAVALRRFVGLIAGLAWGAAIAWVQLRLTWELTGVAGFVRPLHILASYSFPPAHLAQFVLPEVFLTSPAGVEGSYWNQHQTTGGETLAYVGVVPWILAFAGGLAVIRASSLALWRWIVVLSLALATMPGWWPGGFLLFLTTPGVGWFRAPARYTLVASLGLALLAGRGLDNSMKSGRFWKGLALAALSAAAATAWSIHWAGRADFRAILGDQTLPFRFAGAGLSWSLGIAAIIGWRTRRLGDWAPVSVAILELVVLFFTGPIRWGRPGEIAHESNVLRELAKLPSGSRVSSRLFNLPVEAGQTTAKPYLGILPPPPNYLLMSGGAPAKNDAVERRWQRRFGVTYGVWGSLDPVWSTAILGKITDPVLDRVLENVPAARSGGLGPWTMVRVPDAFPPAWVARHNREAPDWGYLFLALSREDLPDEAWFLAEDHLPATADKAARTASVRSWDGRTAVVDHDGACTLILQRTYYPGWTAQIDSAAEQPVLKVNGGLQGIPLTGSGTSQVTVHYRPTGLLQAALISATGLIAVCLTLVLALQRAPKNQTLSHC